MKNKNFFLSFICICFLVVSLFSIPVFAETVNCTSITSLPYTINNPGIYCLKANRSISSGSNAITINADNVTIDLNGFALTGINTSYKAIFADGKNNITIKNGIVSGFGHESIVIVDTFQTGSKNAVIENLRLINGSNIRLDVSNSVIRNNQLAGDGTRFGIYVSGGMMGNTLVVDNDIYNTTLGIGASGLSVVFENNRIGNPSATGTGSLGIEAWTGNAVLVNNRITNMDTGILFYEGTGKYRDNITVGCTTPIVPGNAIDAGNNNW